MRSLHHHATPTSPEGPAMTNSRTHNGQIPTDPHTLLVLALAVLGAATQLTPDQAQALVATGGIAEVALLFLHLTRGRR